MARIVTVFGARGKQGSSVVRALAADPSYEVRAASRKPRSKVAQELKTYGIHSLVKADFYDPSSLERALAGAYGCFLVTDYWATMDPEKEIEQAENVIKAALKAGVQHLVFSGLESIQAVVGKPCWIFDAKAKIEGILAQSGLPFTSIRLAEYYENQLDALIPEKGNDGRYSIHMPTKDVPVYGVSVYHIGECVRSIFNEPDLYLGRYIGLAGDCLTARQHAEILSKHLAPHVFYDPEMSLEDFKKHFGSNSQEAEQLTNMFEFFRTGKQERDIELTRRLNPVMPTFDQWVLDNKDNFLEVLKQ